MDFSNLDSFRKQIAEAQATIHKLYAFRKAADESIADLRDLIRANANFLPEAERYSELLSLEMLKLPETIAEAVKIALFVAKGRKIGLTPVQLKEVAEERGFDFSPYTNPMASVHSILKRMKEADPPEVDFDESTGTYSFVATGLPVGIGEDAIDRLNSLAWKRLMDEEKDTADRVAQVVIKNFLSNTTEKRRLTK